MYGASGEQEPAKQKKMSGINTLLQELSDDEDENVSLPTISPNHVLKPWLREFQGYLEAIEGTLPDGMTAIQWWGVSFLSIGDL